MNDQIHKQFEIELQQARKTSDSRIAWKHLERAHILSQPFAWHHCYVHLLMLKSSISERDPKEFFGQLVRIVVAAPGSWTGKYPLGNTGRANVDMLMPMQIPEDLQSLLSEE